MCCSFRSLLFWAFGLSHALTISSPLPQKDNGFVIDGAYVVALQPSYTLEQHFDHLKFNVSAMQNSNFRFISDLNIYGARLDTADVEKIKLDPSVRYVSPQHYVQVPDTIRGESVEGNSTTASMPETHSRWATDRPIRDWNIRMLTDWGRLQTPIYEGPSLTLRDAGKGVRVYILDTGVHLSHVRFDRPGGALNFQDESWSPYCGREQMEDFDGHGTHVAGIVKDVAFSATIVNVKVICPGASSVLMAEAIVAVTAEHLRLQRSGSKEWRGSVINLSMRTGKAPELRDALFKAVSAGIPITTSAGNAGEPEGTTPCGWTAVQCVAASSAQGYAKPPWSNYGKDVTIVAPGDQILSASHKAKDILVYMSGTSMASPHVAGVMAIFVGYEDIHNNVEKVVKRLQSNAQNGVLNSDFAPDTINRLANTGINNPSREGQVPYFGAPGRELLTGDAPPQGGDADVPRILSKKGAGPGMSINSGTELRILGVGDSITVGFLSERDGGDGNGYRLQLQNDLSRNRVVYAGTESHPSSTMVGSYFGAWSGKTIKHMADHIGPSLQQRPNIILLYAGTNDMNPDLRIATEGNDPASAAQRLGSLIDQIISACPDATILVAMIANVLNQDHLSKITQYRELVPEIVSQRRASGHHVLAVDFSTFSISDVRPDDGVHPTVGGYRDMGDYWYDFITQIPTIWVSPPVGPDPDRSRDDSVNANGGLDGGIPAPNWGTPAVTAHAIMDVIQASNKAKDGGARTCNALPTWQSTGQIALGLGKTGDWHYNKQWVEGGKIADGIHKDHKYVRLHDMNGDGKADYVWVDPITGETRCWLNNLPNPWSPAGNNNSIIASGAGPGKSVFFADMNGDRREDYLVVNPNTGAVDVYWNYGPDNSWANGWKFVPAGQIASGVPHANLATLRFPDINGDGRADYVYLGKGGSVGHWLNTGSAGGQDVLFVAQGGIATGASDDVSKIVFADMDGDGRDDYLIWDNVGGLTGFLNQRTQAEGVPLFINQGLAKSIADGITQDPSVLQLVDMDGDGKDDYVYIDQDGALWVWYNHGTVDHSMAIDGLRFADIDGDGLDDYIWLDPISGAATVYQNKGPDSNDVSGWKWSPLTNGTPMTPIHAPASQVKFADINGDGKADLIVVDPKTGALNLILNLGPHPSRADEWAWNTIGKIASGLGPGADVRFADIDGDGYDDYILLHPNGGTTIYRNVFWKGLTDKWAPMPEADASGISQRPEEISFYDIDGDGKADYIHTSAINGSANVWINNYPNKPTWIQKGQIAGGVGTSGANVRYAMLQDTARASYVAVDPTNGAISAWLNGCNNLGKPRRNNVVYINREWIVTGSVFTNYWSVYDATNEVLPDICKSRSDLSKETELGANMRMFNLINKAEFARPNSTMRFLNSTASVQAVTNTMSTSLLDLTTEGVSDSSVFDIIEAEKSRFPPTLPLFTAHGIKDCGYLGDSNNVGRLICPGVGKIVCTEDPERNPFVCSDGSQVKKVVNPLVKCSW